jgi:hypothetical protein
LGTEGKSQQEASKKNDIAHDDSFFAKISSGGYFLEKSGSVLRV